MRLGVSLVDGMSHSLLNFSRPGDPKTVIISDNVTVQVKKERLQDADNETVVTNQGRLDLPDIASLIDIDPDGCVQQSIFFASFNPQMYVESSPNVNSHTLRFNLESCDENVTDATGSGGSRRRRRRRSIGDEAGKRTYFLRLYLYQSCPA